MKFLDKDVCQVGKPQTPNPKPQTPNPSTQKSKKHLTALINFKKWRFAFLLVPQQWEIMHSRLLEE